MVLLAWPTGPKIGSAELKSALVRSSLTAKYTDRSIFSSPGETEPVCESEHFTPGRSQTIPRGLPQPDTPTACYPIPSAPGGHKNGPVAGRPPDGNFICMNTDGERRRPALCGSLTRRSGGRRPECSRAETTSGVAGQPAGPHRRPTNGCSLQVWVTLQVWLVTSGPSQGRAPTERCRAAGPAGTRAVRRAARAAKPEPRLR